jgi:hypothetical protein
MTSGLGAESGFAGRARTALGYHLRTCGRIQPCRRITAAGARSETPDRGSR